MFLVLIETSGNQDYIFATNKLRENLGASEWISRVGEAVRKHIESDPGVQAEVVVATSGKAIVLVRDEETARAIVRAITKQVVKDAPGVDLHGVISADFEFDENGIHEVVRKVHKKHMQLRGTIPGPQQRFLRLPVIAECATSGLPAAFFDPEKGEPRSTVSRAKRQVADDALDRMGNAAGGIRLARTVAELDRLEEVDWLAVVHADGNGLGQMFLGFGDLVEGLVGNRQNRSYVNALRDFSDGLDACTKAAFQLALKEVWPQWIRRFPDGEPGCLPLVPLVLGGDDLTVVCDGRLAIPFTVAYLQQFETQTANGIVGDLAEKRKETPARRLGACAGVAIVKPHFPFYAAYGLAEELLKSAKTVKSNVPNRPCSAFDFHVLYDASGADLGRIRRELVVDAGATHLTARPYVVTPMDGLSPWAGHRHVERLKDSLRAIQATDDGRRRLPNSMLHDLRAGLFFGQPEADARLKLAVGRHPPEHFGDLVADGSFFWDEQVASENGQTVRKRYTRLLDAIELAEFWEQENVHG